MRQLRDPNQLGEEGGNNIFVSKENITKSKESNNFASKSEKYQVTENAPKKSRHKKLKMKHFREEQPSESSSNEDSSGIQSRRINPLSNRKKSRR